MTDFPRVVEVMALEPYRLFVRFDDGLEGTFDLVEKHGEFAGAFEALRDVEEFSRVFIGTEWETLAWPCGIELDPVVVHWWATGQPIWVAEAMDGR